ncbi:MULTISPECIES: fumarylacetoacetate hydrolase family protein [Acidovorax]|jgi:2,4-diketo-3-deoxy-L-fuconate hydrolase|uniref:Fumarylacetoacetate hydrolase family protein n=1 Tax=Acidovorax facilis TaxID=12917 RepID=A0ABV8D7K3_9BURK|nr:MULTISPECIES: fumarylacetoacetate hydrolase family protein [Acidovorax]OGB08676.1 MAG: 2-hydroxyhepta-2,4-diene-1,7-dioate isomerase [Burkholderiales bacterium RIFCSPHIGHO2_02_FULL_64_19]OGB21472.1 MAG: 2-hydroxyhepta-2,4-diene-1,7-dioate isomerase [Burkholderiales bacterium RIFCSPHIGHO2_12_FULL_65_48]OGB56015.1 MAG: 2-hydroxyhepta-2,4-diene-1,7-dioate isomerase [Burkholderiales bacterium RIFCSPLOWO2_12_FULL_64_33]KQB56772.1 2-hydroxyhepta-2,4-diene-1,7-dioate isomerase [Acidovorax sp. SD340
MKLIRYGQPGAERPGLIDATGTLRDLSMLLPDMGPAQLNPRTLSALAAIDASRLPPVYGTPRLGSPVAGVGKIVCVGLNYADHAREAGLQPPAEPVLFMKAVTALSGPNDDVRIPPGAVKTDWEVELGIVIGTRARQVAEADALQHVAGYVLANDVSERAWQMERGGQWDKGKSYDTFAPIGPWLATVDEVPDPHAIDLWLEVNGQRVQNGSTRNFIFGVPTVVSYISQFMTLEPGDVVLTGTPAGVGLGQKPAPWFLKPGDVMRLGATGLGEQVQKCVGG